MIPEVRSLFSVAGEDREEVVSILMTGGGFRLEQIVSFGAASASGFWYDQESAEWVLLVRGGAGLEFEGAIVELVAGDYLLIPAHTRHRVAHASEDAVWMALHVQGQDEPGPSDASG